MSAASVLLTMGLALAHAGDGQVLHVGETTALRLDGGGWVLDAGASRKVGLVSVTSIGSSASSRFQLRGLKPGQAVLVFRRGQKTYEAHVDVLR